MCVLWAWRCHVVGVVQGCRFGGSRCGCGLGLQGRRVVVDRSCRRDRCSEALYLGLEGCEL